MAPTMTCEEFLSHKKLALVRLSPQTPVMGAKMNEELRAKDYEVSVVYLNGEPTLMDVRDEVEGAIISVPRSECEAAVRQAVEAGVQRLWVQAGCDSKEGLALAEKAGIPVIHGACVLMYAQPVQSIHAFHRWVAKVFGRLKK